MSGFGYKTGWLAFHNGDLPAVVDVLGGRVVGRPDWEEAVQLAYREQDLVLATPLIPGVGGDWLLTAGQWVARHTDMIDIGQLSAALREEVQIFVTHRGVDLHAGNAQPTVSCGEHSGTWEKPAR